MKAKKTAAVYDRWLFTLGGGEQVAFAYAETLRDLGYTTSILTHKEIDVAKAQDKMNVDLTDIELVYLPIVPSAKLSEETEKYDVFINTSYLDYFPNRSKRGVLSVFFPGKIFLSIFDYLKIVFVLPSLKRFFVYPIDFSGFRFDEKKEGKLLKWLGRKSSIVFNRQVKRIEVTLFFPTLAFSILEGLHFQCNDIPLEPDVKKLNHRENTVTYFFTLPMEDSQCFSVVLSENSVVADVALESLTIPGLGYFFYNSFKHFFPRWEMRLHGGPELTKRADLESYDTIITISDFVSNWVQKYWHLPSRVLYPPVATRNFQPSKKKKNWIIHIGRFFVTGHSKKQLDMAKVFAKLSNNEKIQDWELHFIGSVHEGAEHRAYFDAVQEAAKGYNVFFHTDVSFKELKELVSQAKIYWHATGLDADENTQPILMEHFGITTVEAMAAGCVPVVIGKGGQKEIVTTESGFTWRTRDELYQQTMSLLNDARLLKKLSEGAVARSKYFDKAAFKERFAEILREI